MFMGKWQSLSARHGFALGFIVAFPCAVFTRAVIFSDNLRAFFTLDCAAPVKFAVAAADHLSASLLHSEAAFVAQPAAAPPLPLGHVPDAFQALPPFCALQSQTEVLDTVIWGILQIYELRFGDAPKGVRYGSLGVRAVARSHWLLVHLQLPGVLVLHPQVAPHLPEIGQLHPAGLDAATSRHPMTFAGSLHGCYDRLPTETEY